MTTYKVHADVRHYQSIVFDTDDYLDVLDPSIGEKEAMFLPVVNKSIREHWSPIELSYFHNEDTVDLADISIWKSGLLLMNEKAHKSLAAALSSYGEFLSCELHGKPAYIFNALVLKSDREANITYATKNGWKQGVASLEFNPIVDEPLFKFHTEQTFGLFCSEAFKQLCEIGQLKGIYFTADLTAAL
jgi:hypothetical protein